MSYKFSFADNATYSAQDVNAITKRLVTSGVEDSFTDGVAYNVSKFNEAGKLLYTSGAVPESCLSLKVEDAGNGKILINPGKAFFDDGAVIEIEAGGETLSYISGSKNYVYLKNDLIDTNRCYPYCGTVEPTGDYVMLAEISESGAITDKRTYAKGKLPGYQSVTGNVMRIQGIFTLYNGIGSAEFDIGSNNFEYIMAYERSGYPFLGIYEIASGLYLSFRHSGNYSSVLWELDSSIQSLYIDNDVTGERCVTSVTFSITSGKLTVNAERVRTSTAATIPSVTAQNIDLLLF